MAPGPPPKRDDQRRHRRPLAGGKAEQAPGAPLVEQPAADEGWHPLARDWYVALAASGQSRFYEPGDWATARVGAAILSQVLTSGRPSSQLFAEWSRINSALLGTEGDRRRARIELVREQPTEAKPKTSSRDRLRAV